MLPLRDDTSFRRHAKHVTETGDDAAADKTGISGVSILSQLTSIDFPRSFPPDCMHLFFENIIPLMVKHYRGAFIYASAKLKRQKKTENGDECSDEADKDETMADNWEHSIQNLNKHTAQDSAKQQNTKRAKTATMAPLKIKPAKMKKFDVTNDEYNIPPSKWEQIGKDQEQSANRIPSRFGRAPRRFDLHCHEFTAEEWKMQCKTIFSFKPEYVVDLR
jgi:hypothetical protein